MLLVDDKRYSPRMAEHVFWHPMTSADDFADELFPASSHLSNGHRESY